MGIGHIGLWLDGKRAAKFAMAKRAAALMLFAFLFAFVGCPRTYADVGIVLNESLDTSVAWITGSGHSAVYISRACPETPVKLRLCRPGEEGSVISNYTTLGEDQPYQWNGVTLSMYLYGVEDARNRPLFGSPKVKKVLEERYREKYLGAYCTTQTCLTSGKSEWREMVAATISRSVYIFIVKTTPEQDKKLIDQLNSEPNVNHFNGVTRNCATFTRHIMDTYFPGSTKPDYITDFGMTSPKSIARSFSHYAARHPGMEFRVLHFAQVPGTYRRSSECREGTEQLYHSKKLLLPMAIFAYHELPVAFGSYVLMGRFNPEHEWEKYPTAQVTELSYRIQAAQREDDNSLANHLAAKQKRARKEVVGTKKEWKGYQRQFGDVLNEAVAQEAIPDADYVKRFFKYIDEKGEPMVEPNGSVWMSLPSADGSTRLGLSASNLLAPSSDEALANDFMLARVASTLKSPKHSRETMPELKTDWSRLKRLRFERLAWAARMAASGEKTESLHAATNVGSKHSPNEN
ncbi:MAG TPA: hypothetical protein VMF66_17865 [Candidatus Acidoferrum sp.]|nr:hypothetical protein [Candidatus Acidoferrum sp.]